MKIIPDGVVDEALGSLGFATGLVLEYHIVIPSEGLEHGQWISKVNGKIPEI